MVKHLKSDLIKINYDFFKTPPKEPSQSYASLLLVKEVFLKSITSSGALNTIHD